MIIIFNILMVFALLLIIFQVPSIVKHKTKKLLDYEKYASNFRKNINPLVSDEDTPIEILEVIKLLNNTVNDKKIAQELLFLHVRSRNKMSANHNKNPEFSKEVHKFFNERPELEKKFIVALRNYFAAIIINNTGFVGFFARYLLKPFVAIVDSERLYNNTASTIKSWDNRHHGHCHAS